MSNVGVDPANILASHCMARRNSQAVGTDPKSLSSRDTSFLLHDETGLSKNETTRQLIDWVSKKKEHRLTGTEPPQFMAVFFIKKHLSITAI